MAEVRKNVVIDEFVVMPNHFHGLIILEDTNDKDGNPNNVAKMGQASSTLRAGSLGAIIGQFKVAVTRRAMSSNWYAGQRIWQRNYHDHVVRNEESFYQIRRYIRENPGRWHEDSLYVD